MQALLCSAGRRYPGGCLTWKRIKDHEKNYSAYLLEMAAAVFGIEHFDVYLRGKKFVLYTDHKPLEKLSAVHTKTLNRLQQLMTEYHFEMRYTPGDKNTVADYLSRNVATILSDDSGSIQDAQKEDDLAIEVKRYIRTKKLPTGNRSRAQKIKRIADKCIVQDGLLWHKFNRTGFREKELLYVPDGLREMIVEAAHVSLEAGHGGEDRTRNRVMQDFWWPGLSSQVAKFVQKCEVCRLSKSRPDPNAPLVSMPLCTVPNERVHVDLFGPLKVSQGGHKYIMVMTDAFTKLVELAAIEDKTAETVARHFFEKWICRYSAPKFVVTDQGKEFCNQVLETVCELWGTQKKRTSSFRPQTNSSAESYNRSIIKYMRAVLDNDKTTDWEHYLAPMMLSYNTHVHRATKETPFFLTYLHDPRLPVFDLEKPRKLYGENNWAVESFQTMQAAQLRVHANLGEAQREQEKYFNQTAKEKTFKPGDKIMIHFPNVPQGCNQKFFTRWRPFKVVKMVGPVNVAAKEGPHKKEILVHVNRARLLTPAESASTWTTDYKTEQERPEEDDDKENKEISLKIQTSDSRYNLRPRKPRQPVGAIHLNGEPGEIEECERDERMIVLRGSEFQTQTGNAQTGKPGFSDDEWREAWRQEFERRANEEENETAEDPGWRTARQGTAWGTVEELEDTDFTTPKKGHKRTNSGDFFSKLKKMSPRTREALTSSSTVEEDSFHSIDEDDDDDEVTFKEPSPLKGSAFRNPSRWHQLAAQVLPTVKPLTRSKGDVVDMPLPDSCPTRQRKKGGQLDIATVLMLLIMGFAIANADSMVHRDVLNLVRKAESAEETRESKKDNDMFTVQEVMPRQQFISDGVIYTETIMGHITIRVEFYQIYERIEVATKAASRRLLNPQGKSIDDFLPGLTRARENMDNIVRFFMTGKRSSVDRPIRPRMFMDDPGAVDLHQANSLAQFIIKEPEPIPPRRPGKQPRSMNWASMLGLFNAYEGKKTMKLAEANSKAVNKVMEEVDAVREYAQVNNEQMDEAKTQVIRLGKTQNSDALKSYWERTKGIITAVEEIAAAATRQRLHTSIRQIIDLDEIWRGYVKKVEKNDWVPAFLHSQHLHQVPASYAGGRRAVDIQVHIPLRQKRATAWRLLKFIPRPMLHNQVMLTILPIRARLAVDLNTDAYMEIEKDVLDACTELPNARYCPETVKVVHTDAAGSCLAAIWSGRWTDIEEMCWIRFRKPRTTAWAEGPTKFIVIAPNQTTALIKCDHKTPVSASLQGYLGIMLAEGCILTTKEFELHAGNGTFDERFSVSVDSNSSSRMVREIMDELEQTNISFSVKSPISIHSAKAEVKRIIEEGQSWTLFSTGTWIALSVALVAVVIVIGFITFLWCRIKFSGVSTISTGFMALKENYFKRKSSIKGDNNEVQHQSRTEPRKDDSPDHIEEHSVSMVTLSENLWEFEPLTLTMSVQGGPPDKFNRSLFRIGRWEDKETSVFTDPSVRHNYLSRARANQMQGWYPRKEGDGHRGEADGLEWASTTVIGLVIGEFSWNITLRLTDSLEDDEDVRLGLYWMEDLSLLEDMFGPTSDESGSASLTPTESGLDWYDKSRKISIKDKFFRTFAEPARPTASTSAAGQPWTPKRPPTPWPTEEDLPACKRSRLTQEEVENLVTVRLAETQPGQPLDLSSLQPCPPSVTLSTTAMPEFQSQAECLWPSAHARPGMAWNSFPVFVVQDGGRIRVDFRDLEDIPEFNQSLAALDDVSPTVSEWDVSWDTSSEREETDDDELLRLLEVESSAEYESEFNFSDSDQGFGDSTVRDPTIGFRLLDRRSQAGHVGRKSRTGHRRGRRRRTRATRQHSLTSFRKDPWQYNWNFSTKF